VAVVFDEVVGTVVPPAESSAHADEPPAPAANVAAPGDALRELRRAVRRSERVRAD
jgi:hypothetical protein